MACSFQEEGMALQQGAIPLSKVRSSNRNLYHTMHWSRPPYQDNCWGVWCRPRWQAYVGDEQTFLEVGCGNGKLCQALADEGKVVTGVDLAAGPYDRTGYSFIEADVSQTPLPQGFDVVLSFDVLEHLFPEQVDTVLQNMNAAGRKFVLAIAGFELHGLHETVRSPGWWLNKLIANVAASWTSTIVERNEGASKPVYLFLGEHNG